MRRILQTLREHKMASRYKGDVDIVFASETGRPMNGRNVSRRGFDKALAAADLGSSGSTISAARTRVC